MIPICAIFASFWNTIKGNFKLDDLYTLKSNQENKIRYCNEEVHSLNFDMLVFMWANNAQHEPFQDHGGESGQKSAN